MIQSANAAPIPVVSTTSFMIVVAALGTLVFSQFIWLSIFAFCKFAFACGFDCKSFQVCEPSRISPFLKADEN